MACFIKEGVRRVYGFLSALFPPFKVFRIRSLACIFCLSLLHLSFPPRKGARFTLVSCGISIINFRFKPSGQRRHLLAFSKHFLPPLIRFLIFVMASLDPLPLVFPLVAIFFAVRQIPKLARHVPRRYTATTTNYSPPDVVHA